MENNINLPLEDVNILEIIRKFLRDNEIEETPDDAYNRIKEGKNSWFAVIKQGSMNLLNGKITDDSLAKIIKKEIGVSEEKSLNLIKNIKNNLLPLISLPIPTEKKINTINSTTHQKPLIENKIKPKDSDAYREPI